MTPATDCGSLDVSGQCAGEQTLLRVSHRVHPNELINAMAFSPCAEYITVSAPGGLDGVVSRVTGVAQWHCGLDEA